MIPRLYTAYQPEEMILQGGVLKYRSSRHSPRIKKPSPRGKITTHSAKSRHRLILLFCSLDWESYAADKVPILWATLTTSPEYWESPSLVYRALRRFMDWLQTLEGFEGAIVRKEYGRSGMLHYHLILFGLSYISASFIRSRWAQALRFDGKVRIHIERVESPERIIKYISKYASKAAYSSGEAGVSLSKCHNVDTRPPNGQNTNENGSDTEYTGTRYWYIRGKLRYAQVHNLTENMLDSRGNLDHTQVSKYAVRTRRIFRKWYTANIKKYAKDIITYNRPMDAKLLNRYCDISNKGWGSQNIHAKTMLDRQINILQGLYRASVRKKRWLTSGTGYSIIAQPSLLIDILAAAYEITKQHLIDDCGYVTV